MNIMRENQLREEIFSPETPRKRQERLRKALGALGIAAGTVIAGYSGGVIAASAFPAEVSVGNIYQAEVSLSASPADTSRIHLTTTAGDLEAAFDSWSLLSPGIRITPRLNGKSIEMTQQANFGIESFIPSASEEKQAITSAAEQLALRFWDWRYRRRSAPASWGQLVQARTPKCPSACRRHCRGRHGFWRCRRPSHL